MKVVLIGFMGSGKSTISKKLAKQLHCKLLEMDEEIVNISGYKNIPEIFKKKGEVFFRELEIATAKRLQNVDDLVISTGGGVVMNKINLDYLKKNASVIFLDTSFKRINKRIGNQTGRPLFKNLTDAKKLFDLRHPLYENYADIKVQTKGKKINEIVAEIISKLN